MVTWSQDNYLRANSVKHVWHPMAHPNDTSSASARRCTSSPPASPISPSSTGRSANGGRNPRPRRTPDLPLASAAELHAILDRFAKQGYATADQSYQAGIRGISVPIRDAAGGFICTLSVVAPTQRKSIVQLRKLAPDLQAVAQRISANVMGRRDTLAPSWPATG